MPDSDDPQELTDGALQSEIELVGDLVVAATSAPGPLGQAQIDRLLGIAPGQDQAATPVPDSTATTTASLEPTPAPAPAEASSDDARTGHPSVHDSRTDDASIGDRWDERAAATAAHG